MYVDLEVMDRFEELECIISNASSIPFSHKSGIDKEEVLELINNIKAHNRNAEDPSQQIQIEKTEYEDNATVDAPTEDITLNSITILSAKTYTITFAYDPNSGYVTSVGIIEKEATN